MSVPFRSVPGCLARVTGRGGNARCVAGPARAPAAAAAPALQYLAALVIACSVLLGLAERGWAQSAAPPPTPPKPSPLPSAAVSSSAVVAHDTGPDRAVELHDKARQLYAEGRYREAIALLDQAVKLDPNGQLLYYNLGLIHELLGELESSLASYRRSLALETDVEERGKLDVIIKRLEGVRSAGGLEPRRQAPRIAKPSERGPHPLRRWIWVSTGGAAGFAAVGVVFALRAVVLQSGAGDTTGEGATVADLQSEARQTRASAIVADTAFALAGASAVAGMTLALLATGGETPKRTASLVPTLAPSPGGAALRWRF